MCLDKPDELSEDLLNCDVCTILNSMMKHFADCPEQYLVCTMCIQMFSFICIHAYDCKRNQYQCEIALCIKFHHVLGEDTIRNRMKCLWFNIKKKLARVLGCDDGIMTTTSTLPVNPPNLPPTGGMRYPSLTSIPENTEGSSSRPGSQVLARKRSNKLPSVPEQASLPPERPVAGELTDTAVLPQADVPVKPPLVRKTSASRFVSLPVVGGGGEGQQYPSYTNQPVGRPGICKY